MDELKQELTMDEHKIPITELYSRLNSDPNMVRNQTHLRTCRLILPATIIFLNVKR